MRLSVYAALAFSSLHLYYLLENNAEIRSSASRKDSRSSHVCFFAARETEIILNRFSQTMSLIDLALPGALITATALLFRCIARLVLIPTGSSYIAISIPFSIVAVFALQHVYLRTSSQLRFLDLENKSAVYHDSWKHLKGFQLYEGLRDRVMRNEYRLSIWTSRSPRTTSYSVPSDG
jgi:hypothetical protein